MTTPRARPTSADRPRPDGTAAPGERLAALLAEAGGDAAAGPSVSTDDPDPGPAHRWEVAARTRVPVPLLLLAAAGLAVLAWSLLGAGGDPVPDGTGRPVLADVSADDEAPDGPEPSPAGGPEDPLATPGGGVAASPSPGPRLAVHVTGEVARPGVVQVDRGARVVDAVEAAGGLTEHAATAAVNLAAPVADGQQVLVPDARAAPAHGPLPEGTGAAPPPGAPAAGAPAGPVNLNTASAQELETLPRIGPVLAGRIVAFREQQGGFAVVEELDAVPGIGPTLMEALLPLVTV
ncbi:helix-hairpin-helix domain-containing protein [Kocuria sp. M1R5S2]|uniref:helix-hairpin-helix domain-containing protein n=1 Tax=Kocuria rhizosphaerae TaxID=3376285 RepID=UPI00378DBE94